MPEITRLYTGTETRPITEQQLSDYRAENENASIRESIADKPEYNGRGPSFFFSRKCVYEFLGFSATVDTELDVKGIGLICAKNDAGTFVVYAYPADEKGDPVAENGTVKIIENGTSTIGGPYISQQTATEHYNNFNSEANENLKVLTSDFIYLEGQLLDLLGHIDSSTTNISLAFIIAPYEEDEGNKYFSLGVSLNSATFASDNCPPRCYGGLTNKMHE